MPALHTECKNCKEQVEVIIRPKFYTNDQLKAMNAMDHRVPKWNFHLSATCTQCGKWIKHAPQTEEIINHVNEILSHI